MKLGLILVSFVSLPVMALSKVAKLDCSSPSSSISVLEEFGGGGYKVLISRVSVADQSRSGFDVIFANLRNLPATLLTAALPGYTLALSLPARKDLSFSEADAALPIPAQVVINGVAEAANCTPTAPAR